MKESVVSHKLFFTDPCGHGSERFALHAYRAATTKERYILVFPHSEFGEGIDRKVDQLSLQLWTFRKPRCRK